MSLNFTHKVTYDMNNLPRLQHKHYTVPLYCDVQLLKNHSLIMCSESDSLELLSLLVHVTVVPLHETVARKLRDETKQL